MEGHPEGQWTFCWDLDVFLGGGRFVGCLCILGVSLAVDLSWMKGFQLLDLVKHFGLCCKDATGDSKDVMKSCMAEVQRRLSKRSDSQQEENNRN